MDQSAAGGAAAAAHVADGSAGGLARLRRALVATVSWRGLAAMSVGSLVALSGAIGPAAAETRTWAGTTGSWTDPANWSSGTLPVPGTADYARINKADAVVTLDSST